MDLHPRQSQTLEGVTPVGIPFHGFIAGVWTGVAVSAVVLLCRLIGRFRGLNRLYWDDVSVIAAFVLVVVTGALWQWGAPAMYYVLNVQAGIEQYDQTRFFPYMKRWLLVSLIVELFFYTSLLLIKLAFLLFFKRLGQRIKFFKWVWWPVLSVTLASYFGSVGNVHYKCLVSSMETILGECNTTSSINFAVATLKANCALDIFTDFAIMSLPAILLWRIQIRRSKKLAILGLFSLSVITMVIAIVRVATINLTRRPDGNLDSSYLWFWSAIEPPVAIIVCCLSAFPQLFTQSHNKKPAFTPSESRLRMMARIRSKKTQSKETWAELGTNSKPNVSAEVTAFGSELDTMSQKSDGIQQPVPPKSFYGSAVHVYRNLPDNGMVRPDGGISYQAEFFVTR